MFCSFSWLFLCSDRRKYLDFNFDIHGDGQVVVINFTDGMKFEVLPAFCQLDWLGNWNGKYDYPDSNMVGNWLTTDPKIEQQAMKEDGKC